jgi:hypothetical protein
MIGREIDRDRKTEKVRDRENLLFIRHCDELSITRLFKEDKTEK